ncbi:MAG: sigma-70 family RNA polymerase sigma factor [Phycisphaeraceae bacterium]
MAQDADAQLLDRARAGDRQALGALLTRHERRLYNVILRMVRQRDDAAELTQQALTKIIEHLPSFRGDAAVGTWMTRIAMNEALAHVRRGALRRTTSLDAPIGGNGDGRQTAAGDYLVDRREPPPARGIEMKEERERLEAAIAGLEPEFRAVLVLRDVAGMDYGQIAAVLELALGTVKSRLFRARLALREQLSEQTSGGEIATDEHR